MCKARLVPQDCAAQISSVLVAWQIYRYTNRMKWS